MKTFGFMLLLLCIAASALEITDFIHDNADLLTATEEQELRTILTELYDTGQAQYAVVTIDTLDDKDITGYAWELAEGVLGEEGKNNGLLLLVALEERQYRFEVGRGLEPTLPDGKIGRIGRTYLVPHFKEENYGTGIIEASKAIHAVLAQDTASAYYVETPTTNTHLWWAAFILLTLMIIISYIGARGGRSSNDYFIAAGMASTMYRGSGFGGFGGGSFGGGGAGGSWRQIE